MTGQTPANQSRADQERGFTGKRDAPGKRTDEGGTDFSFQAGHTNTPWYERETEQGNRPGVRLKSRGGGASPALSSREIAPWQSLQPRPLQAVQRKARSTTPPSPGAEGNADWFADSDGALRVGGGAFAPALKSSAPSGALADAFATSAPTIGQAGEAAAEQARASSPAAVADAGFSSTPAEVPYRQEMEASFGADFSNVKAYTGGPARKASEALNAEGYTVGDQVAFKDSSPDRGTVAHELTHVLQQTRGPARKPSSSGIDTEGEPQAERVEAAVKAGLPARSALGRAQQNGAGKEKGIARKGFGLSMTFSKENFEASQEYTIWDKTVRIPVPGAPWLWLLFDPSVKVQLKDRIDFAGKSKGTVTKEALVTGEIGMGVGGGVPEIIEAYGTVNPTVSGGATYVLPPVNSGESWRLTAGIVGAAAMKVGVKLGGVVDKSFVFASGQLFEITGIYFDKDGFQKEKIDFKWGPTLQQFAKTVKTAFEKVKKWGSKAKEKLVPYAKTVSDAVEDAWGWVKSWF